MIFRHTRDERARARAHDAYRMFVPRLARDYRVARKLSVGADGRTANDDDDDDDRRTLSLSLSLEVDLATDVTRTDVTRTDAERADGGVEKRKEESLNSHAPRPDM